MIKLFKKNATSAAVLVAISLSGCARFEQRIQANGDFDYQSATLQTNYQTGSFSTDEARTQFNLPTLTATQLKDGFLAENVDIRPPTQLMPVIDGVSLLADPNHTKVIFADSDKQGDIKTKVWQLLKSYLAANKINLIKEDQSAQLIETEIYSQQHIFSAFFSSNEQLIESSYRLSLVDQGRYNNLLLNVELLAYAEFNDDIPLKFEMTAQRKKSVELDFVNDLLAFAYHQKQAEEQKSIDAEPLAIRLGFDDNHQNIWVAENSFAQTWGKIESLLTLLNFEVLETDRNLGYMQVEYSTPDEEYWEENNLNPFVLKYGKYYVQLGELDENSTSISWLDSDKKPIEAQKVTDMYLSIADKVRGLLLKRNKQTKAL